MMSELYAMIDKETLTKNDRTLEWVVERAKSLGATMLQYRNKNGDFDEQKADLLKIKEMTNLLLIVNDNIELADYCDGVHLGQEDLLGFVSDLNMAAMSVRHSIGRKIFGLSTHSADEIAAANFLPIDYIGLGAYRKSTTKSDVAALGNKLDILAKASKKPVAAIGGVKLFDDFRYAKYIVVNSGLYENL